jgi:hypothetical protein
MIMTYDEIDPMDYRATTPYHEYCKLVLRSMPKGQKLSTRSIREAMGDLYSVKYPLGDVLLTLTAQGEITLIGGYIDFYIREQKVLRRAVPGTYNGRPPKSEAAVVKNRERVAKWQRANKEKLSARQKRYYARKQGKLF